MKTISANELRKAIRNLPTELGLVNKSDVMEVITALEEENEDENGEGEQPSSLESKTEGRVIALSFFLNCLTTHVATQNF